MQIKVLETWKLLVDQWLAIGNRAASTANGVLHFQRRRRRRRRLHSESQFVIASKVHIEKFCLGQPILLVGWDELDEMLLVIYINAFSWNVGPDLLLSIIIVGANEQVESERWRFWANSTTTTTH